jgi:ABC-type lipoprotein release transport system permease subunit
MRLYLRMAWRNVWRQRRRTMIVALAIGSTLALLLFYDGLLAGFEQSIYGSAIQVLGGNIQIHADGYENSNNAVPLIPLDDDQLILDTVLAEPQVLSASRRINTAGLASNHEGAYAVEIIGVEPENELPISRVAQNVAEGRYLAPEDQDVIFIGMGLAKRMDVTVGDRITLVGRATHNQNRKRTMTVVGIYDVGMPDIEKRTLYMSLGAAQDLYDLRGQSTEVSVSLNNLGREEMVISRLQPQLTQYEVRSWQSKYPELQAVMGSKTATMTMFGLIILGIVGIGILNLLLMAVYERTREIGLLGAMGVRPAQISMLFIFEGIFIGLVGLIVGVAMGLFFNFIMSQVGFDYSAFTSLTEYTALIDGRVYSTMGLEQLPIKVLMVFAISVLASFYPAREAARSEPAEALHYV